MKSDYNPIQKTDLSNTILDDDTYKEVENTSKSSGPPYKSKILEANYNQSQDVKLDNAISKKKSMTALEVEKFKTIPLYFHLFLLLINTISSCSSYYTMSLPNSLQNPLKSIGIGASQTVCLKTYLAIGGLITLPFSGVMINKFGDASSLL